MACQFFLNKLLFKNLPIDTKIVYFIYCLYQLRIANGNMCRGTWLAPSVERGILNLRVVNSNPTLSMRPT